MRAKYNFEIVDMEDSFIAVPVGRNAGSMQGVLRMNKTGKDILEMLIEGKTLDEIEGLLAGQYEDDRMLLKTYVCEVIEYLHNKGILFE